jgi:hypothetical protein
MSSKESVLEELRFEDQNDERKEFQKAIEKQNDDTYKYNIFPVVKIEKRTDGKNGFKDIFYVFDDLKSALPKGEELFANRLSFRSTIKQTITFPKKWFNSVEELKKYYFALSKSLNIFLYDDKGMNRYLKRDYRVIDFDIYLTDVKTNTILASDEIQELFK